MTVSRPLCTRPAAAAKTDMITKQLMWAKAQLREARVLSTWPQARYMNA